MGKTPSIPQTDFPAAPPSPFDENILMARRRARKRALAAFGVSAATLTDKGMRIVKKPIPTVAGSVQENVGG